jgi:putative ABC transport system permease protein
VWNLARKILFHDRVKFAVASAGVSISVLLVMVQIGMYQGFMHNASNLIDHSPADIWVTGEANENFDFAAPIDDRAFYRVASVRGVKHAERMILMFGQFKLPEGGNQGVQVVGVEPNGHLMQPWNVIEGDPHRITETDGITVDRTEFGKLRIGHIGEGREISGHRAEVVALTTGIRSFTTSPFVFTNLDTARLYTNLPAGAISYVLVEAEPGIDVEALRARIDGLPHLDAYTGGQMSRRTQHYWSSRTGVGTGFFTNAVLAVIVGLVVVGQILYNGTLEHIREYGTLKAMGARGSAIVRVILYQALITAAIGFVLGGLLAMGARAAMAKSYLTVELSPQLAAATAVLTAVMCSFAALLSVIKVLRLDPATVFKG